MRKVFCLLGATVTIIVGMVGFPERGVVAPFEGAARPPVAEDLLPDGACYRLGTACPDSYNWGTPVGFSPDGKMLAYGVRDTIHLWDLGTRRERGILKGHKDYITTLAFSPDNSLLATGSCDHSIGLWDVVSRKSIARFQAYRNAVSSLAFAPDGLSLVSGSSGDARIRFWDRDGRKRGDELDGRTVAYAPDGRFLAYDGSYTVKVRDAACNKTLWQFEYGRNRGLLGLSFAPDGHTLAAAFSKSISEIGFVEDGCLCLWDTESGRELHRFPGETSSLAFAPDGRSLLAVGSDGTIRLWERVTGTVRKTWFIPRNGVEELKPDSVHIAYAPDGRTMATGHIARFVLFWDVYPATGDKQPLVRRLTAEEEKSLWVELGSADAQRAHRAMGRLLAAPEQTIYILQGLLQPVEALEEKKVGNWISLLDHDDFNVRERAMKELADHIDGAAPAIVQALKRKPSVESKCRLERLLQELDRPSTRRLQQVRAVELLELIHSPSACRILTRLAAGYPTAEITRQASASLKTLEAKWSRSVRRAP
jgi:hypothetical protein